MRRLTLTDAETSEVQSLATNLASCVESSDDDWFLDDAAVLAHLLPERLRRFLCRSRLDDRSGAFLISGHLVDDDAIGATPSSWKEAASTARTKPVELLTVLYAALVGDAFAWVTQQDGHIVNDIVPIAELSDEQVGASSSAQLEWHTEDAFHPMRPDYVALFCLRNPDGVATSLAESTSALRLVAEPKRLYERCVVISPDAAHVAEAQHLRDAGRLDATATELWPDVPSPVLTGCRDAPELCIDPAYMRPVDDQPAQLRAVADLCDALERTRRDIVLEPGDYLLVDNRRVVHGRQAFPARYDGTDRWLKRTIISRDLRRARSGWRHESGRRLI
jgi:Fe(II)/alpha-ketoglutarate-dependent arginine beta-hydroxylase